MASIKISRIIITYERIITDIKGCFKKDGE